MHIGFISTRLNGTDGVSLEVAKWSHILQKQGHEIFYCAGELGGYANNGTLIPKLHFGHQSIRALSKRAFGEEAETSENIRDEIYNTADELRAPLRHFILSNKLDCIVVQNALTIPMNLPLGVCLTGLIAELGISTIAHHHDFFWERQRYKTNNIIKLLDTTFPAKLPTIQHVTLNSIAQARLRARRGIESIVIPNVFDFSQPTPEIDDYNNDLRKKLGLKANALFILQPTRVIQRKGIEMAIELVHRMNLDDPTLFISHRSDDEGLNYWHWLKREAYAMNVNINLIDHLVRSDRTRRNGYKYYSLADAYLNANIVTYPSLYEGFGNALLESVYYKRLTVVNCYPVYNADIKPLGLEFVEFNGFVDNTSVERIGELINDQGLTKSITDKNFEIAREHFSFEVLEKVLTETLNQF